MSTQSRSKILIFLYLSIICCFPTVAYCESRTETAGTILQILIPAFALGYSAHIKDYEGCKQLLKSSGSTFITTQILKVTVAEERPFQKEEEDGRTFPSGHTSFAFSGASYLHTRYGYQFGIPAYLAASYVGYSRVYAQQHNWVDVLAGAAIGIGFNYLFTTPYSDKYDISIDAKTDEISFSVSSKF